GRDGGGCGIALPLIFDRGKRHLADLAALAHHRAHSGGATGELLDEGGAPGDPRGAAPFPPPPSNGGACVTGCQPALSGVITLAMMFLSGQFPEPSFFGLPFSTPISAMKLRLSKSLRSAT